MGVAIKMPVAKGPVIRALFLLTGGLCLVGGQAQAAAPPTFVDAPGDLRGTPAKVSTQDLSVQFQTVAQAQAAAEAQGATFVHLKHISQFKGLACGYFEYSQAVRSSHAVLERKEALLQADGLATVEYVFRTLLPITVQTPTPQEESFYEDSLFGTEQQQRKLPNDPKINKLWGMRKISAPKAWETHTDASNVVLFLTDSGINLRNDDIKENLWTNSQEIPDNKVDDDNNGYVDDIHGIDAANGSGNPQDRINHGSHCACTIAGRGDNGFGVVGVAWKLQIASCKAFKDDGTGKSSWQTKCFDYLVGLKKRGEKITVTSNSWGSKGDDPNVKAAFEAASSLGLIHAVAAGNYGDNNDTAADAIFPASYDLDSIISVIWTGENDRKNRSSNYGHRSTDLAAPGTQIYSCHGTKNGHYNSSGTSMAAPHVGGALALMSSYARKADAATLRKALLDSVDKVPALASMCATGGRLNVAKALSLLEPSEEEEKDEGESTGEASTGTTGEGGEGTTDAATESGTQGESGDNSSETGSEDEGESTDESATPKKSETPEPSESEKTPSKKSESGNMKSEKSEESQEGSAESSDHEANSSSVSEGCSGCRGHNAPASPALVGFMLTGLGLLRRRRRA